MQGRLTLPQWGLLNGHSGQVTEYILSHPLPLGPEEEARQPGYPLVLPCIIEFVTQKSVRCVMTVRFSDPELS